MIMESGQKEEVLSREGLIEVEIKKCCADCKTTTTPLWRSGPSGPKSLCNACGIRHRKKRPASSPTATANANITATSTAAKNDVKKDKIGKRNTVKLRNALNVNLMGLMERKRISVKRSRSTRQWGEVERAALLLMALSCGAVFA